MQPVLFHLLLLMQQVATPLRVQPLATNSCCYCKLGMLASCSQVIRLSRVLMKECGILKRACEMEYAKVPVGEALSVQRMQCFLAAAVMLG